ncbi:uncharacterized protein LOC110827408 isoform X4 [Zootermopsis nevadensis]|uniref:uncharacterized protein LOC110827408 isoform X4 n=1 Tax=Zootermopsis nevadensis TaxID=136037 RepID=UPI000B8E61F7|nr:uncharacterized protein LOC110827408 isoform X4 [Zootermopsis nevadensis]
MSTAISMEEGMTQEQIYENLRLHKEVLSSVKQQPWGMHRKLRLVQQAKAYVKRHEGELQERLAQSKTTRDILASFNIIIIKKWRYLKRELANLVNLLIPWELRIKEIESHFGSVVASYFTFLRWLFWVNLVITVLLVAFVIIPEMLTADPKNAGERKEMLPEERTKATNLITLWNFEGVLKYSPIFYGYYTNRDGTRNGYRLPFAYFMTGLAVYIYSFVATLKRMAENSRMSKLSEKDDECVFTWKLFTGWDYMIGNAETAHNRTASIILGFKEALLEEAEKKRNPQDWKIIGLRVLVNFAVVALLAASVYAVVEVVKRSEEPASDENWWRQNEITMVLTLITFVYPIIFEVLGFFEGFHPRKQLRLQLARIMVLNFLNLYTLIFALLGKISFMTRDLQNLKPNTTTHLAVTSDYSESSMPWSKGSAASTSLPAMFESSNVTSPSDVTASIMMIVTALSSAPHMLTNVTSFLQTVTEEPTELTSVVSKLASLLNFTKFTSEHSDVTTFLPVFNRTEVYFYDATEYNSSILIDAVVPTEPTLSSESIEEFGDIDNFLNLTLEDFMYDNFTFINELMNVSSCVNISDVEYDLPNSSDGRWNRLDSDTASNFDMTSNISCTENITFEITEEALQPDSTNLSSEQNLDDTTDSSVSFESVLPLDYVSVANFSSDDDNKSSTSASVTENELLISTLITTLTTLLAQEKDSSNTSEYIEQISQILQEVTTGFPVKDADLSKCDSTQCHAASADASATIWEPVVTVNTINERHFSTAITVESTVTYGSSEIPVPQSELSPAQMDMKTRRELRRLCWETMFGQELVKLTVMDLVVTVGSTLIIDFIRALFVRVMNSCWCWDLEKQFPQYGDFKIAENILHLVNNQGMVWMGMFFSPGLPLLNLIKLVILMYLRSWAVLTCNVPHEVVFRASRSNNFYFALLLTMLFFCVLPVGYAIVWVEPSWHCGPFSGYKYIYHIFTKSLQKALPKSLHRALDYIASPGTVIPLLLLLVLVIYYLVSLTGALREANNDLKIQLRRERTEERRKMFQLMHHKRRGGSGADKSDTPYIRWRKILPVMPSKSLPGATSKLGDNNTEDKESIMAVGNGNIKNDASQNEILTRIMKRALRKSSATSDEESMPIMDGDGTDIELHDSLPEDRPQMKAAKVRPQFESYNCGIIETSFDVEQESVGKAAAKNIGDESHHHHAHRKRSEHRHKSPSSSSTNKEREDSLTSAWSDNIPVIRISKTDSSECIQQRAEPQRPTKFSSGDTVIVADDIEPVHKSAKTLPSSDSPSLHKKTVRRCSDDQFHPDGVRVDNNGHKRLVQALITESEQKKNHRGKDEQKLGDAMEMTCKNTPQKQHLRKDEAKKL